MVGSSHLRHGGIKYSDSGRLTSIRRIICSPAGGYTKCWPKLTQGWPKGCRGSNIDLARVNIYQKCSIITAYDNIQTNSFLDNDRLLCRCNNFLDCGIIRVCYHPNESRVGISLYVSILYRLWAQLTDHTRIPNHVGHQTWQYLFLDAYHDS